jgi:hypothetical protein
LTAFDLSIPFEWVTPTSEGSILLKFFNDPMSVKFEIDNDGEIGVMSEEHGSYNPLFYDLKMKDIPEFLAKFL